MNKQQSHLLWSLLKVAFRWNRHGIYKHRDFHALLERERALADRHNRTFSLLEFTLSMKNGDRLDPHPLLQTLSRRLRRSDITGWAAPSRIGVILPDTPAPGAWALAGRICREVSSRMPQPVCRVCTYPSDSGGMEPVPGTADTFTVPPESAESAGIRGAMPDMISRILHGPPPFWKRGLDVAAGSLALAALAPLMVMIALLIKLVSRGPILYRQERVGYLGRSFTCWKFRTMHVNADTRVHQAHFASLMREDVPMTKLDMKADPRLIPLGRYLRASGVDELPQLFNVIKGDMSLVGPRPCIRYEFEGYQRWQRNRCNTLPGLTGLWQTSGKNRTTFTEMMRLDISYAQRKNLWFDLMMLGRTVPAVLSEIRSAVRAGRRR